MGYVVLGIGGKRRAHWECPVCCTLRKYVPRGLQELLGDVFEHFESLDSLGKASFVLGSEL